jgi:hypothetical protein
MEDLIEILKEKWRLDFNYVEMPTDNYIKKFLEDRPYLLDCPHDKILNLLYDYVLARGEHDVME